MITYELAKKLKDAGFPQMDEEGEGYYVAPEHLEEYGVDDNCYAPTLSEFIEACGDRFSSLEKSGPEDREWLAMGWDETHEYEITVVGSTPEEAVANLWLALNKK